MTAPTDATKALDANSLDAELLGAIARGWCSPENAHKVMDPDLAFAIAREVSALAQPAGDAVGEVVEMYTPICSRVNMYSGDLPIGTKLYTAPPAAASDARDAAVKAFRDNWYVDFSGRPVEPQYSQLTATIAQQPKGAGQ